MDNLKVFPYFRMDSGEWSIPDGAMAGIWVQLEKEEKVEHLFYDGSIIDLTGWLQFIKEPILHLVVVADTEKQIPVHVAWLKDIQGITAWAHHCSVGRYRRGAWEAVRDYWQKFDFIHLVFGLTPATNVRAVKFLERICGWTILGTVPGLCNLAYEGRFVPGVVSYYQLHEAAQQEQEVQSWEAEKVVERAAAAVA